MNYSRYDFPFVNEEIKARSDIDFSLEVFMDTPKRKLFRTTSKGSHI